MVYKGPAIRDKTWDYVVEILEKIRDQTSYTEEIKGQKVEDREGDALIIYEWFQTTVNSKT